MDGKRFALIALSIVFAAGCAHHAAVPFGQWVEAEAPYTPAPTADNAFDAYALAAQEVEAKCAKYLHRNFFTPQMKQDCIALMQGALSRLEAAATRKCVFQFRAHMPGRRPPYQEGWRLLGRALVWQIEQAVIDGEYGAAVKHANRAISFGFDLVGGGPLDASLGLAIVDEARVAISPALQKMSPENLAALQQGVIASLLNKPLLTQTFENARRDMLASVQYVQDAFRDERWKDLEPLLDRDARPAIDYLKQLRSEDPAARARYFEGFSTEAKAEIAWLIEQSRLPAYKRSDRGPEDKDAERPWKRFAKHFFMTGRPLLGQELGTLARTRLLAISAAALRSAKAGEGLGNLNDFPIMVRTDPYSGTNLIYRGQGADFLVYSAGADCRDDGGETDDSFTAPDLLLESGR